MYKISNAEYALLMIIIEKKNASGYEINEIIQSRGFYEWADIGTTSIYNGLKKLEKKGLAQSKLDVQKSGKGPVGYKFHITEKGYELFSEETIMGLSRSRERERFFALAMAGSSILNNETIDLCLNERIEFLKSENKRLKEKIKNQDRLNQTAKLLFDYALHQINAEIRFIQKILPRFKDNKTTKKEK